LPETIAVLASGDQNGFPALVRFVDKYIEDNNLPYASLGPEILKRWMTPSEKNEDYANILEL
jgi:hypothetical protein